MKVTVFVKSPIGKLEKNYTVNSPEELEALKKEWKKYPQDARRSTTVSLASDCGYFEQLHI